MLSSSAFEPGARLDDEGFIPLSVPEIRGNEWRYIKECLDTNWVSSAGPFVDRFERAIAEYVGAAHAVAVVNGTAALHIALLVAGVEAGDEVLVPALTFIAPANAARYLQAWPVFIDVEPDYWQLDVQQVADFLNQECAWDGAALRNRHTGRRVRAIVPVHVLGHPVDMDPLMEIAARFELPVIEDATESLGSLYKGRKAGHLGHLACLSFNGNKIVTTGGGGMIVTDNETWARRARYLTTQAKDDALEYIHHEIGYNYRLTNLQAAMGCAQLEHVDAYVARKRQIAATYHAALAEIPGLKPLREAPWARSNYWLTTMLVDESQYGLDSRALLRALRAEQVQTRPLWHPLHSLPAHRMAYACAIEVADRLYRQALSLPCSVGLSEAQQSRVIALLRRLAA